MDSIVKLGDHASNDAMDGIVSNTLTATTLKSLDQAHNNSKMTMNSESTTDASSAADADHGERLKEVFEVKPNKKCVPPARLQAILPCFNTARFHRLGDHRFLVLILMMFYLITDKLDFEHLLQGCRVCIL